MHHTPYQLRTDQENNCRTTLMVPTTVHLACQLRRGGMVFDEGWIRVHRALDSFEVVIDITVPERGVYQLVVLGSGPATDEKFRQALVHEVVCDSAYMCEAPAAVGELFDALGLELDSHPFTVITADEHNHAMISILVRLLYGFESVRGGGGTDEMSGSCRRISTCSSRRSCDAARRHCRLHGSC
jgi:hypothetical protein